MDKEYAEVLAKDIAIAMIIKGVIEVKSTKDADLRKLADDVCAVILKLQDKLITTKRNHVEHLADRGAVDN